MQNIVVVGSANMDIYVNTEYLPEPGETVISKDYLMTVGGKGANQAVAARQLGADVSMIGKVGDDSFGQEIIDTLQKYKVTTKHILKDPTVGSGMAVIIVDEEPQNVIAVTPGSNMQLSVEDINSKREIIENAEIVLAQLEIPLEVICQIGMLLKDRGGLFILNPAPAKQLDRSIIEMVDVLTPNQTEAKILTGIDSESLEGASLAGRKLLKMGAKEVIVTMGKQGSLYISPDLEEFIPAYEIKDAVDPSGAGDAFMGGFSVALLEGKQMLEAIRYGNLIGGLSTRKNGAMPSMPCLHEVKSFINEMENK